ncbi:septum site-determining protein MinD [Buchnera aphidicola]|uniref:Septum site-determining protein MinD n=1 Tax=Buchnera aphidicola subsp. Tuberolachnus salignus TaxID=98804 RepID=A0A160SYU0_BUCTT|nr:septum site-determining protein MinD [Buchnera aphidicola]CUR53191.1 Septum site-determining protein MinD [Buchnera aphidicola (Tuberolachnus salignus)]
MSRIIVVTSGKGGVGKTTSSASIATGLAILGYKTVVIDFDIGLRNLDLIMGCERRVVYDFLNVINEEAIITQALIRDKKTPNLFILPASQTRDKDSLTKKGVEKILNLLKDMNFDFIICDSPAGIEKGALLALYFADEAIIITNPEISSVRDSDRILGILASKSQRAEMKKTPIKEHLLLTRYNPKKVKNGDMLSKDDVLDILRIPLIGIIPEDNFVLRSSNQGTSIILNSSSNAGKAYQDTVQRLIGKNVPFRFIKYKKKSFLQWLFRR